MATRARTHVRRGILAGTACAALALAAAAVATAHSGGPASITAGVTGSTVTVQGAWDWSAEATASEFSYVGYAISWGDVTSGNDVSSYHIGDGTPATNVVLQSTSPAKGTSGVWGPVHHTYAAAGSYDVCIIIYDLGKTQPFPATGWHSLVAGGPSRNMDNSVDNGHKPAVTCATVTIAAASPSASITPSASASATASATATASPTPGQSVAGVTSAPSPTSTLPVTSTSNSSNGSGGNQAPLAMILLMLSSVMGAVAIKPYVALRRS